MTLNKCLYQVGFNIPTPMPSVEASALNKLQRINFVLCVGSEWNRGKGILCGIVTFFVFLVII